MKMKKRFWGVLMAIVALVVIIPRTSNYVRTTWMSGERDISIIKEIETNYHHDVVYEKFKNGILQYWEGILYFYDDKGDQQWNIYLGIGNPLIRASQDTVYIMDKGLNQIIAVEEGTVKYRYTATEALNDFKVCDNNYVLVENTSPRRATKLVVLDPMGKQYSTISIGEGFIINKAISQNHNFIAINTLVTNNRVESNLLTYDLEGNLLASRGLEDHLALSFLYDERGNLIVVTEEEIVAISRENKVIWENFVDKIDLFQGVDFEYMLVYSGKEGRNRFIHTGEGKTVKFLGYNGQNIGSSTVIENLKGIDLHEDGGVAYSSRTIYLLNKRGNIRMEHKYHSDIEEVFILSNRELVVITKEKMAFIRVNGG